MKAAIIGGGFAGKLHAQAIRKCGVEPYLVLCGSRESTRLIAQSLGVPHWSGVAEDGYAALSDPAIDTVHICTPPAAHAEAVRAALQAGKHILCEKPLAMEADQAVSLASLAAGKDLVTACVFNVRYHMAVQRIREILSGGELGRPLLVHGSYLQEFHALPAAYDWRYDPVRGGDLRAVSEIGTHWFDTVQYMTGQRINSLLAVTENYWPVRSLAMPDGSSREVSVSSEDAAVISLRFNSGALGSVVLSEVSPGRGNYLSVEITCERGNLWWNEEENNHLHIAKKGEGVRTEIFAFGNGFSDTFEALTAEFYELVRTGKGKRTGEVGESGRAEEQERPGEPGKSNNPEMPNEKDKYVEAYAEVEHPEKEMDDNQVLPTFEDGARIVSICDAVRRSAAHGGVWTDVAGSSAMKQGDGSTIS